MKEVNGTMPAWSQQVARDRLDMWLAAEAAVATGQEYQIGTRSLRRADLKQIHEQIMFWKGEVEKLESGRRGPRVMRIVPRDT